MKTLQILAALVICSIQAQASHQLSEFSLNLQHPAWFNVKLGNHLYENPVTTFQLTGIPAGNHHLEVIRFEHGYHRPNTVPVTIFCGNLFLKPGTRTNTIIDRFGNLRILEVIAFQPLWHPQPYSPGWVPVPEPVHGMNSLEFERLKNTVDNLSFESSKMKIIKQALQHQQVTASQVTELVRMMTFDSTRLELAKFAYHKTIDRQNYYMVNDAFTFESTMEDLDEYINHS